MLAEQKVDQWRWGLTVIASVMLLVFLSACSTPQGQQIHSVDSTGETVKFTYDQETPDGDIHRGILECDVEGNELKNCRRLDTEYR